ncbi:hypothetical protein EV193_101778 [Herbihabitans rhizosphaerae]|uniref:Uncharacterized protein n=2 Tax=Herbihabitans rhizosphaerae TaxID=1872711 RepID=A0A4Q7L5J5_9PSEU|nr:hypothetical protein EV193_101778 [Herbihabitans rhizosphaerae]
MTVMMSGVEDAESVEPEASLAGLDEQLVEQLMDRAKAGELKLTGEGGAAA